MRPLTEVPRRVSGYNLDELLPERGFNVARALVRTESTSVTVTDAVVKLTPALLMRTLVVVEFDDLPTAGDYVEELVERFRPIGLEGLDRQLIEDQRELGMNSGAIEELPRPEGDAWLLVQFGADTAEESLARAHECVEWLRERDIPDECIEVLPS